MKARVDEGRKEDSLRERQRVKEKHKEERTIGRVKRGDGNDEIPQLQNVEEEDDDDDNYDDRSRASGSEFEVGNAMSNDEESSDGGRESESEESLGDQEALALRLMSS